ncbi:MAG: roadblock/LC7 domain-containing protein [Guyparkeria sp.]|uniref:roadblock/LC7 domain-containing protein n=1 Tax=Guyparkeria sp. TaxID=2035736 RepID=UPI00397D6B9A
MELEGAMCAALVDSESGRILGQQGGGVDIELAAAGNSEVVRAKLKTMRSLDLDDSIHDILITLDKQYHIIRPLAQNEGVFMSLVLDKHHSNLALARRKVQDVESGLDL